MATSSVTHIPEPSEPQSTAVHSRNLSTISSATLHTSTTLHSQPYEPLLRPITPASGEYYDVVSHQSDRILSLPRWSQPNVISRSPSVHDEKMTFTTERTPRKGVTRLRWSKNILQTIMAAWAVYSTARYLLAFMIYQSITGQAFSLALGVSAGLSFAFASCATILYLGQTTLLVHGFSVHALVSLRSTLHYLSSCCLLGPSLVNLVLIVVWKKTLDLELQPRYRCKLDVDLVWSVTQSLCNHKNRTWRFWVTLSVFRLLITLIIVIAFHLIISSPQFSPARWLSKPRYARGKKSHTRLESCEAPLIPRDSNTVMVISHDPILQRQSLESTKSSPRNRLRPTRSRSSAVSESEEGGQAPSYNNQDYIPMSTDNRESDRGVGSFAYDRFRVYLSEATREIEAALAFARSDDAASASSSQHDDTPPAPPSKEILELDIENGHHHELYDYDEEDDFYAAAASPAHHLSSSDYHQPYLADTDEHIRMLNGYVRRMPTIESMGSREREWGQGSSLGASSQNTNRDRELERMTSSRPATRNGRLSWAETDFSGSSEPRSRSNSLTAQAELLVGMVGKAHATEIGELMRRGETVRMVSTPPEVDDDLEALGEGYQSTTSGSRGTTTSYHTASTGRSTVNSLKVDLADAGAEPLTLLKTDSPPA